MNTIQIYPNRKLYNSKTHKYTNVTQIRELLKAGEDVRIINFRTQEDVTQKRLASFYGYALRHQAQTLPISELKTLLANTDVNLPSREVFI